MDWEWEQLIARDRHVLDGAWSTFLALLQFADDVPVDSRNAVRDCGCAFWQHSEGLNTTRCAVLFESELGVPIVNSSFTYYRDVLPFALAVHWDIDVPRLDLVPHQAQAAFSFIELMQRSDHRREFANRVAFPPGERPTGGSTGGTHEAGTTDVPGADDRPTTCCRTSTRSPRRMCAP